MKSMTGKVTKDIMDIFEQCGASPPSPQLLAALMNYVYDKLAVCQEEAYQRTVEIFNEQFCRQEELSRQIDQGLQNGYNGD